MDIDQIIAGFGALSTPSRVQILQLLAKEAPPEGMKSGDIAKRLGVVQNTLSTQLMMLSHARLVRFTRVGRSILYRVDREAISEMADFLMQECGAITPREAGPPKKRAA